MNDISNRERRFRKVSRTPQLDNSSLPSEVLAGLQRSAKTESLRDKWDWYRTLSPRDRVLWEMESSENRMEALSMYRLFGFGQSD